MESVLLPGLFECVDQVTCLCGTAGDASPRPSPNPYGIYA